LIESLHKIHLPHIFQNAFFPVRDLSVTSFPNNTSSCSQNTNTQFHHSKVSWICTSICQYIDDHHFFYQNIVGIERGSMNYFCCLWCVHGHPIMVSKFIVSYQNQIHLESMKLSLKELIWNRPWCFTKGCKRFRS